MNLRFFKRRRPVPEGAVPWVAGLSREQRRILRFNLRALLESKEALRDRSDPRYDDRPSRSPRTT
jgi:hypothetical protein